MLYWSNISGTYTRSILTYIYKIWSLCDHYSYCDSCTLTTHMMPTPKSWLHNGRGESWLHRRHWHVYQMNQKTHFTLSYRNIIKKYYVYWVKFRVSLCLLRWTLFRVRLMKIGIIYDIQLQQRLQTAVLWCRVVKSLLKKHRIIYHIYNYDYNWI